MTNQSEDRNRDPAPYQSFLVRLWKDGQDSLWRGSAQSVQTGAVERFANLTELFTFLDERTTEEPVEECRVGWRSPPSICPARKSTIQTTNKLTEETSRRQS